MIKSEKSSRICPTTIDYDRGDQKLCLCDPIPIILSKYFDLVCATPILVDQTVKNSDKKFLNARKRFRLWPKFLEIIFKRSEFLNIAISTRAQLFKSESYSNLKIAISKYLQNTYKIPTSSPPLQSKVAKFGRLAKIGELKVLDTSCGHLCPNLSPLFNLLLNHLKNQNIVLLLKRL